VIFQGPSAGLTRQPVPLTDAPQRLRPAGTPRRWVPSTDGEHGKRVGTQWVQKSETQTSLTITAITRQRHAVLADRSCRLARECRLALLAGSSMGSCSPTISSTAGGRFRCCAQMGLRGHGRRGSAWWWKVAVQLHPARVQLARHGHEPRRPGATVLAELGRLNSDVLPLATALYG